MSVKRREERLEHLKKEHDSLPKDIVVKPSVILFKTRKCRLSNPSSETISKRSRKICRTETFLVAQAIQGATQENKKPAVLGLLDPLTATLSVLILACT